MPGGGTAYHSLPKNKDALVDILNAHVAQQIQLQAPFRTKCGLIHHYLRGCRHFPVINFTTGEVKYNYLDAKGNMVYKHQKMLARVDLVKSRLMQMDCYPKVKRRGLGLNDIRRRSVAQIYAEASLSPDQIEVIKDNAFTILCKTGCVGISSDVIFSGEDQETIDGVIGVTTDLEVVHPFELYPYPTIEMDLSKQRGLIRRRWVPLEFLKEKLDDTARGRLNAKKEELKIKEVQFGGMSFDVLSTGYFDQMSNSTPLSNAMGGVYADGSSGKKDARVQEFVELVEFWGFGVQETVNRYILKVGDVILEDEDLSNVRYYCPLTIARFINDGTFYGQGPCDLMMPLNREIERLTAAIFENVRKTDRLGVVLLPQGTADPKSMFHDTGQGLRVGFVEQDPFVDAMKPVVIQPPTSGDFPGKVANLANQMLDDIVPMSSILFGEAPGRVDSAQALNFLDQQANIPLSSAAAAVRRMFGGQYRSIVSRISAKAVDSKLKIPLTRLSEDLVGVVLDKTSGDLLVAAENPVPDESKLEFTIQDETPKNVMARKQEALELLKMGVQTPEQLRMLGYKEGLDFATYSPQEEAAWAKTVLNILVIFNDGKTPGKILDNTFGMVPHVQLQVLDSFMARTEFTLCEQPVRDMFVIYKKMMMEQMGIRAPDSLMSPEDEAMMLHQAAGNAAAPGQPGPGESDNDGSGQNAGSGGKPGAPGQGPPGAGGRPGAGVPSQRGGPQGNPGGAQKAGGPSGGGGKGPPGGGRS